MDRGRCQKKKRTSIGQTYTVCGSNTNPRNSNIKEEKGVTKKKDLWRDCGWGSPERDNKKSRAKIEQKKKMGTESPVRYKKARPG